MNMLSKKVKNIFQKSGAVARKIVFAILIISLSVFLSSCSVITEIATDTRVTELEQEVKKLNEQLDNIYDLFTDISLNIVQANVMIHTYASKTYFGVIGPVLGSQGSGVIFMEDNTYYYILTNNHVIYVPSGYQRIEYKIFDYKMNEYSGELLFNSPDYDLAVMRFKKTVNLKVLNFSMDNPEINDMIIAIGQPEGQVNAITFGKVLGYAIPNCDSCEVERSNVIFDCIFHDANINHGNSGGMLINSNKEIVGINTFGSSDGQMALAVPISKVKEFLELNNFLFN